MRIPRFIRALYRDYPEIYQYLCVDVLIGGTEFERRRDFLFGDGSIMNVLEEIKMHSVYFEESNDIVKKIFHGKIYEYIIYKHMLIKEKIKMDKL